MNSQNDPPRRYTNIDELKEHRYLRHTVALLKNHPHSHELIALHAAVLVDGCRIVSVGYNKPWRPKFVRMIKHAHENLSTHAEMSCINDCKKRDLLGTKMYVARVLKDRLTIAISRPCQYCQFAMDSVGIQRAIYTTYSGELNEMKIEPPYVRLPADSKNL